MPEYIDEGFPISAGRHLAIRYVAALGVAWVVMPNQVHMLPKVQTSMLMRWTKGTPARRANQITRRTGLPFRRMNRTVTGSAQSRTESDRPVNRGEPGSAGLCRREEERPWSTARSDF